MFSDPLLWLEDSGFFSLGSMALPVLVFLLVASVALVLCLVAFKARAGVVRSAAPGLMANLYGFWLVAIALWGGYFFSLRIPGMFDITVDRVVFFLLVSVAFVMYVRRQALP